MTKPSHIEQIEGAAKVLIVDDHPLVRVGLKTLISRESDLVVCGEAAGFHEALRLAQEMTPDVAIVDIALADGSGLALIKRLHARFPDLRLLVCSMHDESLFAPRVIKAGAHGYVGKQEASENVVEAVRRVVAGKVYLSDTMTQHMLQGLSRGSPLSVDDLTDREIEVLSLIGHGLKTTQIAEQLHLSVKTVETHKEKIKRKLNLSSGVELTRYAAQWVFDEG